MRHRRTLVVLGALLGLALGCSGSDGSVIVDDGFEIGGPSACEPGTVSVCFSDPQSDEIGDGYCLEGVRACQDGNWGECRLDESSRLPLLADPELCGGCDPRCFRVHDAPTGRDLREDNTDGLRFDLDRDGLVLAGRWGPLYSFVSNSGESTVSKVDTGTRREVGRYYVGAGPVATALDSRGNGYVVSNGETIETVVKIAGDQSYCIDRNRNGRIDTASGSIPLGRGRDECVVWTSVEAAGACPRTVAVDKRDRLWIGGWCLRQFYVLDIDDGSLIERLPVSASAFDAAIGRDGLLWYTGRTHSIIQSINTQTYEVGPVLRPSCGGDLEGIVVDFDDRVWIVCGNRDCSLARYEPRSGRWDNICDIPPTRSSRDVTIDSSGDLWVSAHVYGSWHHGESYGYRYDPVLLTRQAEYTIEGCDGINGIASDFEDNLWSICHGSWNAVVLDPDTGRTTAISVGAQPYTYSDFTGYLRAMVTTPGGRYRRIYDSSLVCDDHERVVWSQLYFDVDTPEETRIEFIGRTAERAIDLGPAREVLLGAVPGDEEPLDIQRALGIEGGASGMRYLEVDAVLQSLDGETSPVFRNMDMVFYCECTCDDDGSCSEACECDRDC